MVLRRECGGRPLALDRCPDGAGRVEVFVVPGTFLARLIGLRPLWTDLVFACQESGATVRQGTIGTGGLRDSDWALPRDSVYTGGLGRFRVTLSARGPLDTFCAPCKDRCPTLRDIGASQVLL